MIPLGSEALQMTVSIGAVAYPEDTGSARELLRLADEALYRAKGAGRNRVCVSEKVDPARAPGPASRRAELSVTGETDARTADRPAQ